MMNIYNTIQTRSLYMSNVFSSGVVIFRSGINSIILLPWEWVEQKKFYFVYSPRPFLQLGHKNNLIIHYKYPI